MNWLIPAGGLLLLVICLHLCLADSIVTSIACQGASLMSSSVTGSGQEYSHSVFTRDLSAVSRNLMLNAGIDSDMQVSGTGTIGIDEYAGQIREKTPGSPFCSVFIPAREQEALVTLSGLFQNGSLRSSRHLTSGMNADTAINGTGQVRLQAGSATGGDSHEEHTYAAGRMRISEQVRLSGEEKDD